MKTTLVHRKSQRTYYKNHREQQLAAQKRSRLKIKAKVFTHYGGDSCRCVQCGESRLACLSIDHIRGGGTSHRRELGFTDSFRFYKWLIERNYPQGYQTLCMNCQFCKRMCTRNPATKEWVRNETTNKCIPDCNFCRPLVSVLYWSLV